MNDEVLIEIRDLLRLIAEPHIEKRDAGRREKLRQIVKNGKKKQAACSLLDGTRSQREVAKQVPYSEGALSEFVSELRRADLLTDNPNPQLNFYVPGDLFSAA